MVHTHRDLSTGLPELDLLLRGIEAGDNIVWQVEQVADYIAFVAPYVQAAVKHGKKLVYFRFARHEPLLINSSGAEIVHLAPQAGFEVFLDEIHAAIERAGRGAFYVFDCLSDLAADWFSDRMLGNFFMLTCPYLYDLETVTYFALLRNHHSIHATIPIMNTTQLLLDVYHYDQRIYLRPIKVQHRHSPTMHELHVQDENGFHPVNDSFTIAEVLASTPHSALQSAIYQLDVWNRAFLQAEEALGSRATQCDLAEHSDERFRRLVRMVISRDERVLELAERHLDMHEVLAIGRRTIGTGLIGGKAVGMLLARAILRQADPRWHDLLEVHDSFFVASDVFYTFLVRNGCWWIRKNQKDRATFLHGAGQARRRILTGTFPDEIQRQFREMLEYFGQSPIIVRSSSLLEDNFGNAFAGKYESVFCANQGSLDQRLEGFLSAAKTVYASSMGEEALAYRARHNILDRDEQMSLLVQRVSGARHSKYFFPQIAGVGFSFNPFAWSEYIEPEAGMVRLVFGLGTRAVDRSDDDYTRIIALNAPERRPEETGGDTVQHAQRKVDVLDLVYNQLATAQYQEIVEDSTDLPHDLFASTDRTAARLARERGIHTPVSKLLTFGRLLTKTPFVDDMRDMLETLQEAYAYPVDIEFTANFVDAAQYRINLLQCRPLQVQAGALPEEAPESFENKDLLLKTPGPVIGRSRLDSISRIIYVSPRVYGQLPIQDRYAVARLIGKLTHLDDNSGPGGLMLLGPGRWGTTTPSLGVPVTFAEINTVSVLCEIVAMREDLIPDVSLGTHFFSELVEMDMLYLALFPTQDDNWLNTDLLEEASNRLPGLIPEATQYADGVFVIDVTELPGAPQVKIYADTIKQRVLCYLEPSPLEMRNEK